MNSQGFNLVNDPWIPVESGHISIAQALIDAHRLDGWPCSDPAFAEALIRLLVPMVYRITGMDDPSLSRYEFADRQRRLLERGRLGEESVRKYLSKYEDRFWLTNPPDGHEPFAQDSTLGSVNPQSPSKVIAAWPSGNNPLLGPHAPREAIPMPTAAQQLLVFRCYAPGGLPDKRRHPKYQGGHYVGAPLRDTRCVHPVGGNLATTLIGNLVPFPYDTDTGFPFWEVGVGNPVAPHSQRAGLLEQIAVRQDKTMLFRTDAADSITGFTSKVGSGVNRALFCRDPYWYVGLDGEPTKPKEGRAFWRESESLLSQSDDGRALGSVAIVEWAIDAEGGGEYYHSADFSWVVISHRGDQSKELAWECSHAPHLLNVFASDATSRRCTDFLVAAIEAEKQMATQLARVWHKAGLMPSDAKAKSSVYAPARARFWRLAEADFWATARSEVVPDERDAQLRSHALAGYDETTIRLLHDRRTHGAVIESRRWIERWRRSPIAAQDREAST